MLEGFVVFNFNEGVPYVSITKNGITFNKGVVLKLGCPQYARLLINAERKQIALQICDERAENSVQFCSAEKRNSKVLSIRWNGRDLLNTIEGITGWSLSKESYKVEGKLLTEERAMLFDLNEAILMGDTIR